MPPREQKVHGEDYHHPTKTFTTTSTAAPPTPGITNTKYDEDPSITHSTSKGHLQQHKGGERIIFFRIGPLRFGLHGVSGILGTIFVSYAVYLSTNELTWSHASNTPLWLAIAIFATTVQSSVGSYGLLNQVPKSTKIASWIIPPHREAFKRTIAITMYLNIRLVHLWICYHHLHMLERNDNHINKSILRINDNLLFPIGLFIYTNYNFFPINFDYSNGNSWVFVMPMFIGLNIDTFQQFPKFTNHSTFSTVEWMTNSISLLLYRNDDETPNTNSSLLLSFPPPLSWDDVHTWNTTKVNESYLLITLLCALQIAFMFTVAFRGRMNIKSCYWIAALEVGLLCVRLIRG